MAEIWVRSSELLTHPLGVVLVHQRTILLQWRGFERFELTMGPLATLGPRVGGVGPTVAHYDITKFHNFTIA